MKNQVLLLFLSIIIMIFFVGCSDNDEFTFKELYDGGPQQISKITITDGSTGFQRIIDSPSIIKDLINELNNITFTTSSIEKNEINGVLYGVAFYENIEEEPTFTMTTNIVGNTVLDENTSGKLEEIFRKYFNLGRDTKRNGKGTQ